MTLLWKVGNTYHLCGEDTGKSTYASLAGDYLTLFLPVFDIMGGPVFLTGNGILSRSPDRVSRKDEEKSDRRGSRRTRTSAEEEPVG